MILTQSSFEKIIFDLRTQQTESAFLDCKEDLPLAQEGDKASFIRDVAALANNGHESYLIIGIQDKTWTEIGLTNTSKLIDPDQTQNRMNQILEKRLDPQLSIRYQVLELQNKKCGVVIINGNKAPYVIAIDQPQYGGNRTKGQPCHINRGVVYIRHGDTTVIANRQSRILDIFNQINSTKDFKENSTQFDEFLERNAYKEIESSSFGRNTLSQGLVDKRQIEDTFTSSIVPAESWISFLFYPLGEKCKLNPNDICVKLQPGERIGRDGSWFHGLPTSITDMLFNATATPKGILGKWYGNSALDKSQYFQIINILPSGIIHFAAAHPLFYQRKNVRTFNFVTLIGYLWQLIYLNKAIYKDMKCDCITKIILNFIGAKGTVLVDLAKGPQKKWIDIFDWRYNDDARKINQEENFQISREIQLLDSSDEQIEHLVRDIAEEIGHYYNQPIPQCFTPDTNEFPVTQFTQMNNW